jgi:TRAP-type mannitol/chloroaromatic compound transport system permease small subunit
MSGFLKFADWQADWLARIAGWLIIALILAMVYEVFARHLFNAPTQWAFEVAYMLSGTIFLFGIAYCQMHDAHIRVDFIYDNASPSYRAIINALTYLVFFLPGCIWLTWELGDYAISAFRSGEGSGASAWNPVVWPFRTAWTIGYAALILQGLAGLIRTIQNLNDAERGSAPSAGGD